MLFEQHISILEWFLMDHETLMTYFVVLKNISHTVQINMLYLINKIVATDYKQYYLLNWTN